MSTPVVSQSPRLFLERIGLREYLPPYAPLMPRGRNPANFLEVQLKPEYVPTEQDSDRGVTVEWPDGVFQGDT